MNRLVRAFEKMLYATISRSFLRFLRKDTANERREAILFAECADVAVELKQQVTTLRNFVRRGAYEEMMKWIKVLRQRKETQTFIYDRVWTRSPAFRLRLICYRIRWMGEHADYKYDLHGLYVSLTARIMLGLLEMKLIARTIYKKAKLERNMTIWELRPVRNTILKLQKAAASDQTYIDLLLLRLGQCSGGVSLSHKMSLRLVRPGEPGLRGRTEEDKCLIMSRLNVDLPCEIMNMPVDAQICWQCLERVETVDACDVVVSFNSEVEQATEGRRHGRARKCSGCNIARYCSRDCQIVAWSKHKMICGDLRTRLSSAKFQQRLRRRAGCTTWGELLLKELSDAI